MIYLLQIYIALKIAASFTELWVPPAAALGGADQMISQALNSLLSGHAPLCPTVCDLLTFMFNFWADFMFRVNSKY